MIDASVTTYLASFSGESLERLEAMRKIIKENVPDAEESFAYGLIGYKYKKKPLVYIGGFAHHTGFYATPNGHEAFAQEFAPYKQGKGSVQFPLTQPLPTALVKKVVLFRKQTIDHQS